MMPKLKPLQMQLFAYIENALCIETPMKDLIKEIAERFPTYYIFHKVDKEMQLEIIEQLIYALQYNKDTE